MITISVTPSISRRAARKCWNRPRRWASRGSFRSAATRRINPGRAASWSKMKCRPAHEVVIGAWTDTDGRFRSLLAGVYRDGNLAYAGRVGTGFSEEVVRRIMPRLKRVAADQSPFTGLECAARGAQYPLAEAGTGRRNRTRRMEYRPALCGRLRSKGCAKTSRRPRFQWKSRSAGQSAKPTADRAQISHPRLEVSQWRTQ